MCYFFYIFVLMLEPKIKSCLKDCESLTIKDITGFYDVTLNETGWGTPNINKSDLTEATLTIVTPTQTYEENVLETIQDSVFSTYDIFTYTSDSLTDGIYKFTLKLITEDNEYEVSITHFVYCNVECCVDKLGSKLAIQSCDPCKDTDKLDEFILADSLLTAISSDCISENDFKCLLKQLQKICSSSDCGCGCS